MGFLYEKGWGVPQDKAQAFAWYRYAAARGLAKAREEADGLAALMTPAELERGSQFYSELKDKHPIGKGDTSL